jgi:hypothetical protein
MDKEIRQSIAELSREIDAFEQTLNLVKSSNVLCFTTMERKADETVTLEFNGLDGDNPVNEIFTTAQANTIRYLDSKIKEREREIDNLLEKK